MASSRVPGGPDGRFPAPGRASDLVDRQGSRGLPAVRLCARGRARGPGAGADPAALLRHRQGQIRALGVRDRRAAAALLLRRAADCAGVAPAGRDQGRHRRVPDLDAGDRGRFDQPELRADGPGDHDLPSGHRAGHGDHGRARDQSSSANADRPGRPPQMPSRSTRRPPRPNAAASTRVARITATHHHDHATWFGRHAGPGRSAARADAARDLRLRVSRPLGRDRSLAGARHRAVRSSRRLAAARCVRALSERSARLDAADAGDRHPDVHLRVCGHPGHGDAWS